MSAAEVFGLIPNSESTLQSKEGEGDNAVLRQEDDTNNSGDRAVATRYDNLDPVKEMEELDLNHVQDSHREKLHEMLREFTPM